MISVWFGVGVLFGVYNSWFCVCSCGVCFASWVGFGCDCWCSLYMLRVFVLLLLGWMLDAGGSVWVFDVVCFRYVCVDCSRARLGLGV